MRRILACLLILALLTGTVLAAGDVQTVLPEGNFFSPANGWSSGKNATDGIWARTSADTSAATAYVGAKLNGEWRFNVQITPLSTQNGGRAVSRVQLLDQYRNPKLIFTYEALKTSGEIALTLQCIEGLNSGGWSTVWRGNGWMGLEDTALNLSFVKNGDDEITLTILGNAGYTAQATVKVPADVLQALVYGGLAAERTSALFSNVQLEVKHEAADFSVAADQAYAGLMAHFLDAENNRLKALLYGYPSGTVTNSGYPLSFSGQAGAMWEAVVVLMALDTYAQANADDPALYRLLAQRIVNTIDRFLDFYSYEQLVTPSTAPLNHAMDDCGWNVMGLLLGYRYHMYLGNSEQAARCLKIAADLFRNSYDFYYDDALGGGMWYNAAKESKSLYAATLALGGYELYALTADEEIRTRYLRIYQAIEDTLRRDDGLYWMDLTAEGHQGEENPYDISEGGSCTYLGGNLCMAVLNARLGNLEKAKITCEGIALYETSPSGALLNDRDAWNNTFFLGMFVQEVVETGIADARYQTILENTAQKILQYARFPSGYYSAAWEGPREPYDTGYPSSANDYYTGERNRWGTQFYENGLYVGSTPNQAMTSATTAHVILATAALTESGVSARLDALSLDGATLWPVFNPDITAYALLTEPEGETTLHLSASAGAQVTVNGQSTQDSVVLSRNSTEAVIRVSSGDGSQECTYTVHLRESVLVTTHTITWNVNGAETTEIYEAGATPVFKGTTAKADDQLFTYTFVGWSPAIAPVTANVTHTAQYERAVRSVTPSGKFTDVPKNQWYYDEVYTAEGLGLMNGMSAATFEPEGSMTRAMLVTVLWRVEGSPTGSKAHSFTDVESGRWYTEAVSWAAEKGIVNGITTTTFEPETEVTREQLATILYRYAKHKGYTLTGGAELTVFPDGGEVSNYAKEAVSWAVAAGIIGGSKEGGTLRLLPKGSATRAQVAAIFVRFVANIMA